MERLTRLLQSRRMMGVIAVGAIGLVALSAGLLRLLPLGERPTNGVPRIVFAVFGQTSDILYVAPATKPDERTIIATVPHAEGWGLNPAPMYDSLVAYNVIPSGVAARGAPAELWLMNVATKEKTRLARDADLLVRPQFVDRGRAILYRRSVGGAAPSTSGASGASGPLGIASDVQAIVRVDIDSQARTVLHEEHTAFGIFPIGNDASANLVFARLSKGGTDVFTRHGADAPTLAFHASDEIAHDWQMSPDAKSIAFLSPESRAERVVYRASVVLMNGGRSVALPKTDGTGEQYGPIWTPDGLDLTVGQEPQANASAPVTLLRSGATSTRLAAPSRGFDVPVAWSANGTYLAARTFDGKNSTDTGRESVVVIARSGERYAVSAPGEVIFVGWLPNA